MDIRKIKKLIDLMIESDLQALEVKEGEQSISLTRRIAQPQVIAAPAAEAMPSIAAPKRGETEKSPMVGVFYAAPSPGEAPYASVGQAVKVGDVLGIIEAMKIMNPIEATHNGVISEVLVTNGDPVQYDQPLIRYRN